MQEFKMDYKNIIQKIETQLKKYVGNKKAVIGISGGIDSAVVTALCVNALGKQNVLGVLMPYGDQDTDDAKTLADLLGIETREINIKEIVEKFDFIELNKINKGNVMARARMTVLYCFANTFGGLVIGTGNKSEIEIGYFTKYGDGGIDVEPIGALYKTDVYEIAKILNIPDKIINKQPTAGLYDGQTDEGEIGATYEKIDAVLKGEITQGEVFDKVHEMRKNAKHKRKTPPIFKVKE